MSEAVAPVGMTRNPMLKVMVGGLVSGIAVPLMVPVVDRINGIPRDLRFALLALPFAIVVFFLERRFGAKRPWMAVAAGAVTMASFACAVNAAVWIDSLASSLAKVPSNILSGLGGGFVGATVMAIGIGLLPASPRRLSAWVPMVATGTIAGALFAVDNALNYELVSVLFPVWQAAVAVALARVLGGAPRRDNIVR